MKNGINLNISNSQDVIVFNDYKFYEDDKVFENDERNLVPKEFFIVNSPFNIHKYFLTQSLFIEDDLKNWIKYEDVTVEGLYDKVFESDKTVFIEDKKYKPMITRYNKSEDEDDFKTYKLKDIDGLYTELAKVELFNMDQILDFSSHFGLPTGLLQTTDQDYSGAYPITVQSVNYTELNSQLMKYRFVFDGFKDVITENVDRIRQKNLDAHDNFYKIKPDWSIILYHEYDFYSEESDEAILEKEKSDLVELINVNDFLRGRIDYINNTYIMENYFRNLFDYGYFQMSQALLNDSELKKCKNCNHLFEVSADNTEFCHPLPFNQESQCKTEFNNK